MITRFRKIYLPDGDVSRLQDNIKAFADAVSLVPMLQVQRRANVQLQAGLNRIAHGLPQPYVTWWAGNFSGTTILSTDTGTDRTRFIGINATSSAKVDLFYY